MLDSQSLSTITPLKDGFEGLEESKTPIARRRSSRIENQRVQSQIQNQEESYATFSFKKPVQSVDATIGVNLDESSAQQSQNLPFGQFLVSKSVNEELQGGAGADDSLIPSQDIFDFPLNSFVSADEMKRNLLLDQNIGTKYDHDN